MENNPDQSSPIPGDPVKKSFRLRGCLAAIILILILILMGPRLLQAWAGWLVVDNRPMPADAILVLGGGRGERLAAGLELYREGWAGRIYISGPNEPGISRYLDPDASTRVEWMRRLAVKQGVPENSIMIILGPSSTYEEASMSKEIFLQSQFSRILVVTSPYHTRRAYQTFRRIYKDSGIDVRVIAAPWETMRHRQGEWWRHESDTFAILNETGKLIFYLLKYRIPPV
jgi:uncharacterized SAM-binding protein YcdF (DUF218 family)